MCRAAASVFRYPQSTLAHGLRSISQAFTRQSVWSILHVSSWPLYIQRRVGGCVLSFCSASPITSSPACLGHVVIILGYSTILIVVYWLGSVEGYLLDFCMKGTSCCRCTQGHRTVTWYSSRLESGYTACVHALAFVAFSCQLGLGAAVQPRRFTVSALWVMSQLPSPPHVWPCTRRPYVSRYVPSHEPLDTSTWDHQPAALPQPATGSVSSPLGLGLGNGSMSHCCYSPHHLCGRATVVSLRAHASPGRGTVHAPIPRPREVMRCRVGLLV